jgi:hypothetical protein
MKVRRSGINVVTIFSLVTDGGTKIS